MNKLQTINNWLGEFEITTCNKKTGEIKGETVKNRITNVALDKLAETLVGNAADLEIKYLAVGTSVSPLDDADTQLGAEIFRTVPVSGPSRTETGQIETEFTILDGEAVGNIREVAIFCGSTASGTANTGTMLTRILWKKDKSATEEITFKRIDRIRRGA